MCELKRFETFDLLRRSISEVQLGAQLRGPAGSALRHRGDRVAAGETPAAHGHGAAGERGAKLRRGVHGHADDGELAREDPEVAGGGAGLLVPLITEAAIT